MATIQFMGWSLDVDCDGTHRAHGSRKSGGPEECGCLHCRNFAAARQTTYPLAFRQLLSQLGIPIDRESEVWHYCEVEHGLHSYGGCFHFIGQLASGADSHSSLPHIEVQDISECFSIGFTRHISLAPTSFPRSNLTQIDFTATVSWVLDEPFSG
jgi:hypothetical protein